MERRKTNLFWDIGFWLLFLLGAGLRFLLWRGQILTYAAGIWTEAARVGDTPSHFVTGTAESYVLMLRGFFYLVGNRFELALYLQWILSAGVMVFFYLSARKLFGMLAGLAGCAAWAFVPVVMRAEMAPDPSIWFLLLLLIVLTFLGALYPVRSLWGIPAFLCGLLWGILIAAEPASLLFLPLAFGLLSRKDFEEDPEYPPVPPFIVLLVSLLIGFGASVFLNAFLSGDRIPGILRSVFIDEAGSAGQVSFAPFSVFFLICAGLELILLCLIFVTRRNAFTLRGILLMIVLAALSVWSGLGAETRSATALPVAIPFLGALAGVIAEQIYFSARARGEEKAVDLAREAELEKQRREEKEKGLLEVPLLMPKAKERSQPMEYDLEIGTGTDYDPAHDKYVDGDDYDI
jgi:hypothetical protein